VAAQVQLQLSPFAIEVQRKNIGKAAFDSID